MRGTSGADNATTASSVASSLLPLQPPHPPLPLRRRLNSFIKTTINHRVDGFSRHRAGRKRIPREYFSHDDARSRVQRTRCQINYRSAPWNTFIVQLMYVAIYVTTFLYLHQIWKITFKLRAKIWWKVARRNGCTVSNGVSIYSPLIGPSWMERMLNSK